MLVLGKEDIIGAVQCSELVDAMEQSMLQYEQGLYQLPDRIHVRSGENTLLLMPCFAQSHFCTKLVSLFPGNRERRLPVLQGTVVLNDGATGEPLALLNGATLTALRTAAVGSVGVRHLAPTEATTLGIIGAGVQGRHQALFACSQRQIREVWVYSRSQDSIDAFRQWLAPQVPAVTIHAAASVAQLLAAVDVVITATNASQPVLPDDAGLLEGRCIIGVGSFRPEMAEFSRALYRVVDQVFIDTDFAVEESGDLALPMARGWLRDSQVHTLGKLLNGAVRRSAAAATCFKSVGMAVFDLAAARLMYERAAAKGLGQNVIL